MNSTILRMAPGLRAAVSSSTESGKPVQRSLDDRLGATLRRAGEGLSPRALRRALAELQAVVDARISEVEAGRRAAELARWYAGLDADARRDVWLLMSERFAPDARKIEAAREHFDAAAAAAARPRCACAGRWCRRARACCSASRGRARACASWWICGPELLPHLKADARLAPLEAELEHLFATWFDVAFLDLRRISWDSPASLIEKLIRYEAVHDIRSWADVKNRLDSDRRCYGFFHPRMPAEPLIFVEVALVDHISDGITPLLDEAAAVGDISRATTAIFYSISSTQAGLRGVSFGDSLIKHVVDTLSEEFPKLKVFATLSPIPGFRGWLGKHAGELLDGLDDKRRAEVARAIGVDKPAPSDLLQAADKALALEPKSPVRQLLLRAAARYLGRELPDGQPADPVARFHLGNGARVERLNWAGDPSAKGLKQSFGLMVNYLYDLKRLDKHRALLAQGRIPVSREVDSLRS